MSAIAMRWREEGWGCLIIPGGREGREAGQVGRGGRRGMRRRLARSKSGHADKRTSNIEHPTSNVEREIKEERPSLRSGLSKQFWFCRLRRLTGGTPVLR